MACPIAGRQFACRIWNHYSICYFDIEFFIIISILSEDDWHLFVCPQWNKKLDSLLFCSFGKWQIVQYHSLNVATLSYAFTLLALKCWLSGHQHASCVELQADQTTALDDSFSTLYAYIYAVNHIWKEWLLDQDTKQSPCLLKARMVARDVRSVNSVESKLMVGSFLLCDVSYIWRTLVFKIFVNDLLINAVPL